MKRPKRMSNRGQICGCQGETRSGREGGMDWVSGVSRLQLLYIECINSEVLLHSTDRNIQYSVVQL